MYTKDDVTQFMLHYSTNQHINKVVDDTVLSLQNEGDIYRLSRLARREAMARYASIRLDRFSQNVKAVAVDWVLSEVEAYWEIGVLPRPLHGFVQQITGVNELAKHYTPETPFGIAVETKHIDAIKEKENTMNTSKPAFAVRYEVFGTDVNNLSKEDLISALNTVNAKIKELKDVDAESAYIKGQIEAMEAAKKEIVARLDA